MQVEAAITGGGGLMADAATILSVLTGLHRWLTPVHTITL